MKTPQVALLVDTSRSYGQEIVAGVRRYVAEHGPWSLYLEPRDLSSRFPAWLEAWPGDGILSRTGSPEMLERLKATGLPVVELRDSSPGHPFPFVGMDNSEIGKRVLEHFRERGFTRFAAYMDPSQAYFRERIQQYAAYAASLGLPCSVYELQAAARWDQHQQGLAEWLRSLEKPVGIFASSDQLGFWLLDAARRAGISVPEEVAVVGAENDQVLCETASPPLSSVAYPGKAVGYAAAQLLAEWMLGKKKKPPVPQILLPPLAQIATRQSSDIVAVEDPRISKALMFVRERAHTGIGVEDVARRVGMSRSALERAMRSAIGRSPGEEINRMRFSLVERLLVQTDLTLEAIAERVGFQHPQYMAEAFRKRTGETPGQFRQRRKS